VIWRTLVFLLFFAGLVYFPLRFFGTDSLGPYLVWVLAMFFLSHCEFTKG